MKRIALIILMLFASVASADTGLEWPSNDDDTNLANIYAFKFTGAANLPFHGTGDGGVTISWEIYPNRPPGAPIDYGYWTTFFMDENDGNFGSNQYYGAHPYPWEGPCIGTYGGLSPTHAWEIANGINATSDNLYDQPGDSCAVEDLENNLVEYDRWHYQAFTVSVTGTSPNRAVTYTFWTDLTGGAISDPDKIVVSETEDGTPLTAPSAPDLYWGAAPWQVNLSANEKLNGILRNVKIWDGVKTESYLNTNAGADIQLTKGGDADLWYHNPNPTPSDILDKSGATAHDPVWVDVNFKPTLYDTGTPVPTFLGTLITGGSIQ